MAQSPQHRSLKDGRTRTDQVDDGADRSTSRCTVPEQHSTKDEDTDGLVLDTCEHLPEFRLAFVLLRTSIWSVPNRRASNNEELSVRTNASASILAVSPDL